MARVLKRVPMDFDYPLGKVWFGYQFNRIWECPAKEEDSTDVHCVQCKAMAKACGIPLCEHGCPDYDGYFAGLQQQLSELTEPPKGEGYQLWEDTSEGSPISPVFKTLSELCEWCADNITAYADRDVSKEQWKKILTLDSGYLQYVNHLLDSDE